MADNIKDKDGAAEAEYRKKVNKSLLKLPKMDFSTFLFSLNSSALLSLGILEDPNTKKKSVNLPLVKQTIDMIEMLEEKTKGNLTSDERNLLKNILYELRIKYVQAT